MSSDAAFIQSIAAGYRLSQVLYVFAELALADLLTAGPADIPELAEAAQADPAALRRLLRVASTMGLVEETADGAIRLTARGALLRSDVGGSLRPRARSCGEPWQWGPWGELLQVVRTGRPAVPPGGAANSFEFFDQTPGAGDSLMSRMTAEATHRGAAIADAFDFHQASCVVDVGGGQGGVLAEILARYPQLRGILVDLPYAVKDAAPVLARRGVLDRCEVTAQDFREGVPAGGDLYLLSAILHSWDDDDAVRLMQRCFAHADRVLIVDEVIGATEPSTELLLKDLQLMVFSGGRQRRMDEYVHLVARAGGVIPDHTDVGAGEVLMCAARRPERP